MAKVDGTHAGSATKTSASRTGKPHVSSMPKLKVSTGHIQAEGNEDQKASARKGALFLAGVVALYIVYLVFSGQMVQFLDALSTCLLYTSPSPRDSGTSRMPSSA